jgi:hypothetical protein
MDDLDGAELPGDLDLDVAARLTTAERQLVRAR